MDQLEFLEKVLMVPAGVVAQIRARTAAGGSVGGTRTAAAPTGSAGAHSPPPQPRPMRKVSSAREAEDDLEIYEEGEDAAPVAMALDETKTIDFAPEDVSTRSKDREIRAAARKTHKMVTDNAPMIADQQRAEAARKAEDAKRLYGEKVDFISNAIKANWALTCGAVSGACVEFQAYAQKKLRLLREKRKKDAEVDGFGQLIVGLVSVVADVTGAGIVEKVTSEIGKKVAEAIKSAINDNIKDRVKDAVKKESADLGEIEDAIGEIAQGAGLKAEATMKETFAALNSLLDAVAKGAPDKLSPAAQEFITPFLDADGPAADPLLEAYGIPNPATISAIRVGILKGLIETFEKKFLVEEWKDEYSSEVIEDEMKNDKDFFEKHLASAAKGVAKEASQALEKEPKE